MHCASQYWRHACAHRVERDKVMKSISLERYLPWPWKKELADMNLAVAA
jgi:hypothetical protein